ncbi:MAG: nucleotide exchange factor GrpE [Oscillospiraceae bacterium]|nr:nucleotide exchange factor GrpE [Oscillospiraceae bacterium]
MADKNDMTENIDTVSEEAADSENTAAAEDGEDIGIDAPNAENAGEDAKEQEQSPEDALGEKVKELEKKLADEEEKYKRLDAEYYNYRTRSIKEKQEAASEASAKAVEEILSVIDNFERALETETTDEAYKKGVELIFRQFKDILAKLGVEEIEAEGKPFDPNFHHAVSQVEDENFGENTVCKVFQKGYKLGSKVIRCAMVSVANP